MYLSKVARILIASPADLKDYRQSVMEMITNWSIKRVAVPAQEIIFLPSMHEINGVSEVDEIGGGQGVLDTQLVDTCDAAIIMFWSRLGTPTLRSPSGTLEELEILRQRGVPIHVWFHDKDIPQSLISPDQIKALREFRTTIPSFCYAKSFTTELELYELVNDTLNHDCRIISSAANGVGVAPAEEVRGNFAVVQPTVTGPKMFSDFVSIEALSDNVGDGHIRVTNTSNIAIDSLSVRNLRATLGRTPATLSSSELTGKLYPGSNWELILHFSKPLCESLAIDLEMCAGDIAVAGEVSVKVAID